MPPGKVFKKDWKPDKKPAAKPPVDPKAKTPAQRFGNQGSLFRLKNQDKPKAAKPAYSPTPYLGGSSSNTPTPLLPSLPVPLDSGGGGGGGGGGGEPTAPTAPVVPPTPPVPPTFYSRTQDSPYLQLPEQFMAYLNPAQRTQLNTWLQQAGFRGTGEMGQYGQSSYLLPPGAGTHGGSEGTSTGIDLTNIMDPALRQWMAFFLGSMGYGRGITGPISGQAGGIPNFPTLPGPNPGTPPVPPTPPQFPPPAPNTPAPQWPNMPPNVPPPPPGTGGYTPAPGA